MLRHRVLAAARVLRGHDWGAVKWFRYHLANAGVQVSRTTVSRWLTDESSIPIEKYPIVSDLVDELAEEAKVKVTQELEGVGGS